MNARLLESDSQPDRLASRVAVGEAARGHSKPYLARLAGAVLAATLAMAIASVSG
jgi:hypothetical protein